MAWLGSFGHANERKGGKVQLSIYEGTRCRRSVISNLSKEILLDRSNGKLREVSANIQEPILA
jgi:hypothetical protein